MRVFRQRMLELIEKIQEVQKYGPRKPDHGLCSNIEVGSLSGRLELFDIYLHDWPLYSGSIAYPVPSPRDLEIKDGVLQLIQKTYYPDTDQGYNAYFHKGWDKWSKTSKYGRARWELLDWIVERLNEKLALEQ